MTIVDITHKPIVYREATAKGHIKLNKETIKRIKEGNIEKGDPLLTAKIAGILAAKQTFLFIPLSVPAQLPGGHH